jgi:hypothetical protein
MKVSNFFSAIQNGQKQKKEIIYLESSKQLLSLCKLLVDNGLIQSFHESNSKGVKKLWIHLKYTQPTQTPAIQKILILSSPGKFQFLRCPSKVSAKLTVRENQDDLKAQVSSFDPIRILISKLGWSIRPLYADFTDRVRIFGYLKNSMNPTTIGKFLSKLKRRPKYGSHQKFNKLIQLKKYEEVQTEYLVRAFDLGNLDIPMVRSVLYANWHLVLSFIFCFLSNFSRYLKTHSLLLKLVLDGPAVELECKILQYIEQKKSLQTLKGLILLNHKYLCGFKYQRFEHLTYSSQTTSRKNTNSMSSTSCLRRVSKVFKSLIFKSTQIFMIKKYKTL